MSNRCYVHLPKGQRSQVVNLVCMRNNTIYDVPDSPANTDVPALLIESQVSPLLNGKIQSIQLRICMMR